MEDMTATIAVHEQRLKSLESRMKTVEDMRGEIGELRLAIEKQTGSIDKLAVMIETLGRKEEEHEERLDRIEAKPAEKWEAAARQIISLLIAAAVGALLAHIGL
jgi:chromosome segregation ATPase